uniref:Uncharacterized protein n=1 Tax=Ciona savignyi TaxID=51511 RepID=H2ZGC4_CIOSA
MEDKNASHEKDKAPAVTPTVTTKKTVPTGKKKVIRRLVKNAKTGEVIKTEIVRIDSNGETTVTSYPAGTPVPSLGTLQAGTSSKKSIRPKSPTASSKPSVSPAIKDVVRSDVGPSVPANIPGIDDLLQREEEIIRAAKEAKVDEKPKDKGKELKDETESLESTLITLMKRKRQRDPKARKRGLVASTMAKRESEEEDDGEDQSYTGDTDYRTLGNEQKREEEEIRKRKE